MGVFEKIWYTWLILIIPLSLFGWMFFDEDGSLTGEYGIVDKRYEKEIEQYLSTKNRVVTVAF